MELGLELTCVTGRPSHLLDLLVSQATIDLGAVEYACDVRKPTHKAAIGRKSAYIPGIKEFVGTMHKDVWETACG